MVRPGRLVAVVGAFLIGCAALLVNSGSGVRADHMKEQGDSRGAASEEDLCAGTRINARGLTNDVPGCPTGGLLTGTEGADILTGEKGKDEVRALGTPDGQADELYGGPTTTSSTAGLVWTSSTASRTTTCSTGATATTSCWSEARART